MREDNRKGSDYEHDEPGERSRMDISKPRTRQGNEIQILAAEGSKWKNKKRLHKLVTDEHTVTKKKSDYIRTTRQQVAVSQATPQAISVVVTDQRHDGKQIWGLFVWRG